MEKMRRIFPVLFALVLVLGIGILPLHAAKAYHKAPEEFTECPCCGSQSLSKTLCEGEYFEITCNVCNCWRVWVHPNSGNFVEEFDRCFWEPWSNDETNNQCTRTCSFCGAVMTKSHQFDDSWVPVPGTDTHKVTCKDCGATITEPHSVSGWTPVDETNTHQGTCTKCGATVTEEHNVMDWTPVEGTSNHQGTCTICGKKGITVPHDYSLIRNDEAGHWNECVCGLKETEPQAHVWGDTYFTDGETHWQVCTICDWESTHEEHQYNPIKKDDEHHILTCVCGATSGEAVPHEYGNWTPVEDTDTHKGTCACGAETNESHEWGEWLSVDPYSHQRNCTMCGAFESESHQYENGVCTVCERKCTHEGGKATCVAKAICDLCGLEYGDFDLTNHDLVHHDAKPATCTEIGWDAYDTCKREGCGYTTYKEIAALGHDIEHHDAKAATCTEDGWPAYDTCKREGCNYTTLLIMQARLGHDLVHHEAKAATCTEAGWEAYDTCKREGCNYSTYKEIPALGHDLVKHDAKAATCTEAGWDAYDTCSRCSYTTYKEIAAPGDIPGEPVVTAREEPQVGKAGYEETRIYCTVCGSELEFIYKELPALPEPEPEPEPVPDTKEETPGKPDAEIAIAPKRTVLRIIPPESLDEKLGLELSVNQQIVSDDGGVDFQTGSPSFYLDIPPHALKLIEVKAWRLEKFYSDLADRVILDYTGSQEFPLNLDLVMILVYRGDDAQEHWEVLKKTTRLFGNRLRAEVDAALVRKLQSRPFAIIILADDGTR